MTKANAIITIFLTNLGKYNEGELVGMWLPLPASPEQLEKALDKIGINDKYEEYFITDFETEYHIGVGEYSDLKALNEQAQKMAALDKCEKDILIGLLDNYTFDEAMEIIEKHDYYYYPGCDDMVDVAIMNMEETGDIYSIPERLREYFDYQAYANNLETAGAFYPTKNGYVEVLY